MVCSGYLLQVGVISPDVVVMLECKVGCINGRDSIGSRRELKLWDLAIA